MGHRPDGRMPVEERAKQFMPFAALKGLNEALAEAEERAAKRGETISHVPLEEESDSCEEI